WGVPPITRAGPMPPHPRRSRLLSRALAACALLALSLAMTGTAPATRTPTADAAGAKVAMRIVKLARNELAHGVHEIPDGSNRAPAIYRYDLATTPHYYGAPWGAYFASYIARRAGVPIGPGGHGLGYVPTIRAWAKAGGKWTQRPRPGELITFAEHVGVVEAVYPSSHTLTSIEGQLLQRRPPRVAPLARRDGLRPPGGRQPRQPGAGEDSRKERPP